MWCTSRINSRSTPFFIYINDLANVCESSLSVLFADYTNVFNHGHDLSLIQHGLNKELAGISKWLTVNKLSLNIKKTLYYFYKKETTEKDYFMHRQSANTSSWKQQVPWVIYWRKVELEITHFLFSRENCQRGGVNIKSKEIFCRWLYGTIILCFYCSVFDVLQSDLGKHLQV